MFLRYLYFEIKRTLGVLIASLLYLIIAGALLILMICVLSSEVKSAREAKLFTVSLYIPKEDGYTRLGTRLAADMDSFKSLCRFDYEESEQAVKMQVESGNSLIGIAFPKGFATDVYAGAPTSIKLYYPDNMETPELLFGEIIKNFLDMLRVSEAGIAVIWDLADKYPIAAKDEIKGSTGLLGMAKDTPNVGDYTALLYSDIIFKRGRMYEPIVLSPFGSVDAPAYYAGFGIFVLLIMYGVNFSGLYKDRSTALTDCLDIAGIRALPRGIARVISIWLVLLTITITIFIMLSVTGLGFIAYELFFFIPLTLVFAVYFHAVMMALGGGPQGSVNIFVINLVIIAILIYGAG